LGFTLWFIKQAKKAGAKMINPAQRTFWGGYFKT
jgi:uncharacterized glyoxalase superfamily protein PhnB